MKDALLLLAGLVAITVGLTTHRVWKELRGIRKKR